MPKLVLNDRSIRRPAPETGQLELWDTYLPGFGLRLSAGGARTYFVMTRLHGKQVRRTIGKAPPLSVGSGDRLADGEFWPSDARAKARRTLEELARGIDTQGEARRRRKIEGAAGDPSTPAPDTFAALAASYFSDPGPRGGGSLRSRPELERKVKVDLADWAEKPITSITKTDVRSLVRMKAATSPVAANRLLSFIRRLFRWAQREDLATANPAWEIDPPAVEKDRDRVLTPGELSLVWRASEAVGYPFGQIIKLLILTGQRRSEVAAISWAEVEGNYWKLPDDRSKRQLGHAIHLAPLALRVLASAPSFASETNLVFTTGRRKHPKGIAVKLPPAVVSGWTRAKSRLNHHIAKLVAEEVDEPLDLKKHALAPWNIHDLRRTFSTLIRDPGFMGEKVDRLVVSKILNHAEGGMTRIYDRYSLDTEQLDAMEKWARRIEQLVGCENPASNVDIDQPAS